MNIKTVQEKLEKMRTEYELEAYEAGDYDTESRLSEKAYILGQAIEYLWQYEDLMD